MLQVNTMSSHQSTRRHPEMNGTVGPAEATVLDVDLDAFAGVRPRRLDVRVGVQCGDDGE